MFSYTIHAVKQSATVVGTLGYMPDEQQAGQAKYASDIYAVGMIAVQALTGITVYLSIKGYKKPPSFSRLRIIDSRQVGFNCIP
jgi:serine/threonine protein kinase